VIFQPESAAAPTGKMGKRQHQQQQAISGYLSMSQWLA